MAGDDMRKSQAVHGFWVSEPILAEFPLEFKCRKAKAAFGVRLSLESWAE
jgi:hypothetical protein